MSEQRVAWKAVLWALGIWLVHCMAALVLTVVLVACVPRHMRLFDIYELDLPAATILTYDLSQYAVNYWYTFVVPLALDCFLLIGLSLAPPKVRWLARAWSGLALASAFLLMAFAFLSVSLPLEKIGIAASNGDSEKPTLKAEEAATQPPVHERPQTDVER